ncbi:hypothetical protein Tdes44962_MAKER02999 [Teratosphaeria destructans]|uniref:Uncharacterized protein n=1 Tax=Teratosphaeria destructans TaxID=418781 RepID=A0A9W7SRB4_9PEZI|nr:hypothetical protein Tdes44962_MAKER02999 [Teratosphaeria destructans]
MGRQAYLTRLALGRSPFQTASTQNDAQKPSNEAALSEPSPSSPAFDYGQQYDSKGRPISRATQARNARMRRAQNSVLKLVGVVEDKEHSDRESELRTRIEREARHQSLRCEDDRGEVIELFTVISRPLLTWWLDCFMRRVEVGLYDPNMNLGTLVRREWKLIADTGLRGTLLALYPGAVAYGTYTVGRMVAASTMDAVTQIVAGAVWTRSVSLSRPRQEFIDDVVRYILDAIRLALDVALLPLVFYSTAQQIGVAPALPLLPPMRALLPGNKGLFSASWKPCWGWPTAGSLCTPAALLLAYTYLQGDVDEGTPIAVEFTNFSYPAIDDENHNVTAPSLGHDPIGRILYEGYRIRVGIMRWCGWSTTQRSSSGAPLQNDIAIAGLHSAKTRHRTTRLAQLPAKYLSWRLDDLFVMILTTPLEIMMLKASASAYVSSSLPLTEVGLGAVWRLLSPSPDQNSGARHGSAGSIVNLGTFSARLALTFGLRMAIETVIFGGIYRLVRCQGIGNFGWSSGDRGT